MPRFSLPRRMQKRRMAARNLMQNITECRQAEKALRESREELRVLIDTIPQFVWVASSDGYPEYFNQQFYAYLNASYEQITGERWANFVHPDDRQKALDTWHSAIQTGQSYDIEFRMREDQTGEYRWFLVRGTPLVNQQGRILRWFGTCTDIDEKKRTEEALRESEARFRALLESNLIGITLASQEGTLYEANDAFLSLVGYTREDLAAGRVQWTAMTPPEYRILDIQALEEMRATGVLHPFEKEYVTKEGKRVPVLVGGTLFRRPVSPPLVLAFVVDLTASKEIDRQKDLMLSMTSHELKTPLSALKGTLQLIQLRAKRLRSTVAPLPPEANAFFEDLSERLTACARQVDVQTHLINDLLDVSRITANALELEQEHCDLVTIVRETVKDLQMVAPERQLLLALPNHITVQVFADQARLGQVVTNYVTNAIRYSCSDQPVHIGLTIQENIARVWVRDHGPGLSPEAQKQVWQRFHKARGVSVQSGSGKGLGLGLSICQTLIAQHQGEVGVESTLGEGSTFWFTLPIAKLI
ncbi:MAG: PAS domain S-box protein [Ktedonobacteraceae bacterium]|nr:PAS domain S-box protein [Ktedonobacteraceae bacterium]